MWIEPVFAFTVALQFKRSFDALPHRVWTAITDSAEAFEVMGYPAQIDNHVGGRMHVRYSETASLEGVICAYQVDRVFAHTWGDSVVRFVLEPEAPTGTNLMVTHSSVSPDIVPHLAGGWHGFLDELHAHLCGVPRTSLDEDLAAEYGRLYAEFRAANAAFRK